MVFVQSTGPTHLRTVSCLVVVIVCIRIWTGEWIVVNVDCFQIKLKFRCESSIMFKPMMLVSLIEIQLQNENRLPEFCSIRMLHKALFQGDWLWCIIPQFATKITSCILRCVDTHFEDDVVWLAPFLTNNVSQLSRTRNTAIYVSVCVVPRKHWKRFFKWGFSNHLTNPTRPHQGSSVNSSKRCCM